MDSEPGYGVKHCDPGYDVIDSEPGYDVKHCDPGYDV